MRGGTPLHVAAQNGQLEIVQKLAENGANVNQASNSGITPLHVAAQNEHLAVVQFLAEHGADVNKAKNYGTSPLCVAALNGHLAVVQFLAEFGADVNQATNDGYTPLYAAAQEGHLEMVQFLAEHGVDVNQANNFTFTPIYVAAEKGYLEVVQKLAEYGADVNQGNKDGFTPLHVATEKGHLAVEQWLVEHGADVDQVKNGAFTYANFLLLGRTRYEDAIRHYERAIELIELEPANVEMKRNILWSAGYCYHLLAMQQQTADFFKRAEELFKEAIVTLPTACIKVAYATFLREQKRHVDAAGILEQILAEPINSDMEMEFTEGIGYTAAIALALPEALQREVNEHGDLLINHPQILACYIKICCLLEIEAANSNKITETLNLLTYYCHWFADGADGLCYQRILSCAKATINEYAELQEDGAVRQERMRC